MWVRVPARPLGPPNGQPTGRPLRWMATQASGDAGQNPAYRPTHHRTKFASRGSKRTRSAACHLVICSPVGRRSGTCGKSVDHDRPTIRGSVQPIVHGPNAWTKAERRPEEAGRTLKSTGRTRRPTGRSSATVSDDHDPERHAFEERSGDTVTAEAVDANRGRADGDRVERFGFR
jgi:hypothetical protein